MPRTTRTELVVTPEEEVEVAYVPQNSPAPEPQVLQPAMKNAKIKGTWTFFYGSDKYDFVDGQRYDIPLDVFEYLKRAGNIYDTL